MSNLQRSISVFVIQKQVQNNNEEQSGKCSTIIPPGDKVFTKLFQRKWFDFHREGPYEVIHSTGTVIQMKGSPPWVHVHRCIRAPKDSEEESADPLQSHGVRVATEIPKSGPIQHHRLPTC